MIQKKGENELLWEKKKNVGYQHFILFRIKFYTLLHKEMIHWATRNISYTNAIKCAEYKICLFAY